MESASRNEPGPLTGCVLTVLAIVAQVYRPAEGDFGTHYGDDMSESAEFVEVVIADDVRLALTLYGPQDPDATPLLLLHGLSQQRFFWGPVIDRLASRPVAALDQRGHGDSDTALSADYSIDTCARDVLATLDRLGWSRAIIAGHSWGAWVAVRAAALDPARAAALALIDGGLWSVGGDADREEIRRRLRPPDLGIPADQLWEMLRGSSLAPYWNPQVQAALAPTFATAADGTVRTRIGVDRHMRVLDGLLDADTATDLAACARAGTPIWAALAVADGESSSSPRDVEVNASATNANLRVHRWPGALHDVPLQWPALVAGFIDSLVDEIDGAQHRRGASAPVGGTA